VIGDYICVNKVREMCQGKERRETEEFRQAVICHVVFLSPRGCRHNSNPLTPFPVIMTSRRTDVATPGEEHSAVLARIGCLPSGAPSLSIEKKQAKQKGLFADVSRPPELFWRVGDCENHGA